MENDILKELGTNFIEYAVAVNTDRAIPDAKSGLKPVAKRIIYGAFDCGFAYAKPHVKCANIVGNVMADFHPHGDSSIYGALVRLSQNWVMRYPLLDFHGSNGNIDGDGPAHYRYTEARLSKLAEEGLLYGIKKKNVDFIPNYSETKDEPITLPVIQTLVLVSQWLQTGCPTTFAKLRTRYTRLWMVRNQQFQAQTSQLVV